MRKELDLFADDSAITLNEPSIENRCPRLEKKRINFIKIIYVLIIICNKICNEDKLIKYF